MPKYNWKINKESKQIGKYFVIKAVGTTQIRDQKGILVSKKVIAWFTPQIPISTGPELYVGLPGLILEVHVDRDVFLAKEIVVNQGKATTIKRPDKGTVIAKKDYDKMREEQIKKRIEMRKSYRKRRKNRYRH